MIAIRRPKTPQEIDDVRGLMRAFVAWHRERHAQDLRLIDEYFDARSFEDELASLPGPYRWPEGELLLASVDQAPAGCVALRRLGDGACEMKRMFVYPQYHGRGIGRALGDAIVEAGRSAGYATMRLDTSVRQVEAIGLYERLGFHRIDPYYDLPDDLRRWLVFMERAL